MKTHLNPDTLLRSPAFSQAVVVEAPSKTIYVGGQNGVRADGTMAGESIAEQTQQALANVRAALEAAGAGPADVVKWTVLVRQGESLEDAFAASQTAWPATGDMPAITVHVVAGLADPRFLVEIEAIAVT